MTLHTTHPTTQTQLQSQAASNQHIMLHEQHFKRQEQKQQQKQHQHQPKQNQQQQQQHQNSTTSK